MASGNRATNRFPPAFGAMPSARDDRSPGSNLGGGSWQPSNNIWSNSAYGTRREAVGSRDSDDPYGGPPASTGSGAIGTRPEAESWAPWPDTTGQSRTNSGSNSPNRTRDNNPSLYTLDTFGSAVGHGRPRSMGLDEDKRFPANSGMNGYDPYSPQDKRPSHDPSLLGTGVGAVGQPSGSRDSSRPPPSRHSDDNEPGNGYSYFNGGHHPSNSTSQRPNALHTSSFPVGTSQGFSSNFSDLSSQFRKSLTLDEHTTTSTDGGASAFPNPGTRVFVPNRDMQPWGREPAADPRRFNGGFAEAVARQNLSRGMAGDVAPHSPIGYPPAASPRTYNPTQDFWNSRPVSRGLGSSHETERRPPGGQQFMTQHTPTYFSGFYQTGYVPPFPGNVYDSYASSHSNYRPPVQSLPNFVASPNSMFLAAASGMHPRGARELDPGRSVRSSKLEEFRSNSRSNKKWELKEIYTYVVEFSGDQHGSRFIQLKLESANSDEKEQVFREIEQDAIQLMKDVFGNYVIQKFFEHGNQVQKKLLAEKMKGKMISLSLQTYACRVVQKALEHVLVEQQVELARELEPEILKVAKDQNGNHVVQKVIELVPRQQVGFIMDAFRGHASSLAAHNYACRVIQRLLEYGSDRDKADLLAELHKSAHQLFSDQYGNYVVQHIIENSSVEDRAKIIRLVSADFVSLSTHKYASNVVEKCIERGSRDDRNELARQLMAPADANGNNAMISLMKDQYGNYVIQKMLTHLEGADREMLAEVMKAQFAEVKRVCSGRQISLIEKALWPEGIPPPSKANAAGVSAEQATPAQTPALTMETNSPESSSPPSTHASAVGDTADESQKGPTDSTDTSKGTEVLIQEE